MLFSILSRSIFFIVFCSVAAHGQSTPKPKGILLVDLDDTISRRDKIYIRDILQTIKKASLCCNSAYDAIRLICNIKSIIKRGHALAKEPNATTESVILNIIEYLKQNKYGDFTSIIELIGQLSANKKPIYPMITYLQELKKQGYIVIATTNQDGWGHLHYRNKFEKNYGINLNELFEGTLCCHSTIIMNNKSDLLHKNNILTLDSKNNIYMIDCKKIKKPDSVYFNEALNIAQKLSPSVTKNTPLFFIDDAKTNIDGFNKFLDHSHLKGKAIHFLKLIERTKKESDAHIVNHMVKPAINSFA